MRKGFTLLEILIVVIIVAILAAFAVPQFTGVVERSKAAKAKNMLALIAKAEKMYRAEQNSYSVIANEPALTALDPYIDVSTQAAGDAVWTYTVTLPPLPAVGYCATALKVGNPSAGTTITLDQDNQWCVCGAGFHPNCLN